MRIFLDKPINPLIFTGILIDQFTFLDRLVRIPKETFQMRFFRQARLLQPHNAGLSGVITQT